MIIRLISEVRFFLYKKFVSVLYWYLLRKQKNSDNEELKKNINSLRSLILFMKLMPIVKILSDLEEKRNEKPQPEIVSLVNADGFDRVTSSDTFYFLKSCKPDEARRIILHFFPKQKDFDVLVKCLENDDVDKFEVEVLARRNVEFYNYCGAAKALEALEEKTKGSNITVDELFDPSVSVDKAKKTIRESDKIASTEFSDNAKNILDVDIESDKTESIISITKFSLKLIAYHNDDLPKNKRKKIYKILNEPFVKSIFSDGCEYFESCIDKFEKIRSNPKKPTIAKIDTNPTINIGDPSFRSMLIGSDEERDTIIAKLTKYIDDKETVLGAELVQLLYASSEIGWLCLPNKNVKDYHKAMINTFGDRLGTYEFFNTKLKVVRDLENYLKTPNAELLDEAKSDAAKKCRDSINNIKKQLKTI